MFSKRNLAEELTVLLVGSEQKVSNKKTFERENRNSKTRINMEN